MGLRNMPVIIRQNPVEIRAKAAVATLAGPWKLRGVCYRLDRSSTVRPSFNAVATDATARWCENSRFWIKRLQLHTTHYGSPLFKIYLLPSPVA